MPVNFLVPKEKDSHLASHFYNVARKLDSVEKRILSQTDLQSIYQLRTLYDQKMIKYAKDVYLKGGIGLR